MSIYSQFKQKKKRPVDPNAPPRPNLLSHEKRMKESAVEFSELQRKVEAQAAEIEALRVKYNRLSSSMEMLINYVRKSK
jgi:predicted RNase H-like nuclease (RuvC/YqgF family)